MATACPKELSGISTNMANFLAKAYKIPAAAMAYIFEHTDTIEERNFSVMMGCFNTYLVTIAGERPLLPTTDPKVFLKSLETHYERFLAAAVIRTFK